MDGNTMKEMTTNFRKLDKFEGNDFRRWQKKMHFLLTTLKVVYVLTTLMSELLEDATVEAIRIRAKWKNDDYICRGHILNDESISVSSIIDKLPPSWKDFKHILKHGKDDLSLVQLGSQLRIEESLRAQDSDKGKGKEVGGPSVNMTEEGVVKRTTQMLVVRKRGLRTNPKTKVDAIAWWIDSGATTHVCKDHCWFKTYEPVEDGSVLYMGDDHFAHVHGKISVALEFSSGKTITLFNALYVPKLRKNLVYGPMLNKWGYKQVYEFDKYILSKYGVFVGFGYCNNGMFMLNLNKVPDDSDSVYMSSFSTVVNTSLWHARLGHVYYKRILEMSKDDLIPAIDENPEKCTTSPYTPQQNGVAERKNRALKEMVNSMLSYSVIESRDVIFDENHLYSIPRPKDIIPNVQESQMDDYTDDVPNEIPEPQKGCKWIFKRKMKVDGTIDRFKARLVIQGFRQKEGIDYFDTYALVSRITTIKLMLALAAIHNLVIHQMDVKAAFLNGDLDEEVYMKQPEAFVLPGNEHKVWVILCLYVDDMLIFGTDQNQVDETKKFFSSRFSMKDMGEADVILGIKIKHENKGIGITQSHYIEKILKKFNRKIVLRLSRFTSNHSRLHWKAITSVFKYLIGTKDYGLSHVGYPSMLEGYSDASWINHVEDSSSTSGWVFLLRGGAISWASKKQTCITSSTMESEFVALATAGKEA
nr:zinc finger, CCHC-type [Tanacetum cinerariifolium]